MHQTREAQSVHGEETMVLPPMPHHSFSNRVQNNHKATPVNRNGSIDQSFI